MTCQIASRPRSIASHPDDRAGHRWLLIRRHPEHGQLAYYRRHPPRPVASIELVRVGTRWRIEESFRATKTLTGLDEHQVRRWTSWRRWTLIAMLATPYTRCSRLPSEPASPNRLG